jgi:hypothetical protein
VRRPLGLGGGWHLGRQFDVVFVHDALSYMTTTSDLRRAIKAVFFALSATRRSAAAAGRFA